MKLGVFNSERTRDVDKGVFWNEIRGNSFLLLVATCFRRPDAGERTMNILGASTLPSK